MVRVPVAGHEYSIILALASTWRPGGRRLSTAMTTPDIRSVEDGHSSRKSRIGLKNSAPIEQILALVLVQELILHRRKKL